MTTPDMATIAENLRVLKARRRVSDATIAAAVGLTPSAINDRMNGRSRVQADELARFAAFFGVTVDDLLAPATEAVS
ncbi:MAG TPA: helix-turn-helix transcriptional regulator [Nocardioides sp.]|nr:helix-turn-helix transcriptional regulator [Nocardioides sp.]